MLFFKGKLEPKMFRGIDWLTIQQYTAEWKELKRPTNLKNKAEMLKAMYAVLHEGPMRFSAKTPKCYMKTVVSVVKTRGEPVGLFKILDYMDTLRVMNDSPRFRDSVIQKYNSRFM